jgi:hypothetical protein
MVGSIVVRKRDPRGIIERSGCGRTAENSRRAINTSSGMQMNWDDFITIGSVALFAVIVVTLVFSRLTGFGLF